MSKLVLKEGSNNQHLHDEENEFSGFGKQSMRNSNKFMVNISKDNTSKVSEPNLLNKHNNNDIKNDQNEANEFGLKQNNEIGKLGQNDSGIYNRNDPFQNVNLKKSSEQDHLDEKGSKIRQKHLETSKNFQNLQTKNQNQQLNNDDDTFLKNSKQNSQLDNLKQYLSNFQSFLDQNKANFRSGQLESDRFSENHLSEPISQIKIKKNKDSNNRKMLEKNIQDQDYQFQHKDSKLKQEQNSSILQNSLDLISKKLQVHETLILPELKEGSSHFTSNDKKLLEIEVKKNQKNSSEIKSIQVSKIQESLKKVHQEEQSSHKEIEEEIKRQRKDSGDYHSVFHRSENFEIEKSFQNRKRVETECNQRPDEKQPQQKFFNLQMKQNDQGLSVFQTQIFPSNVSLLNSKLSKIKQAKQYKKKKLQEELAKISQEIDSLGKRQAQIKKFGPSYKNFSDRLKINNNTQARQRAISLIKNLQKQRKAREINKISSIDKIDVRISDYMSELSKVRTQNEKRLKQKKKLQIIERMKEKQVKKINEIKKIQANSKFVSQFMYNLERKPNRQKAMSPNQLRETISPEQQKRKSKLDNYDNGMTPGLANKKAYLNRVRNLSQKKYNFEHGNEKSDPYENKLC